MAMLDYVQKKHVIIGFGKTYAEASAEDTK